MDYKEIYTFLNGDLKKIEDELERTLQAETPVLKEASLHYLRAGGKRIRPIFVLLAAKFGDYDFEKVKPVAVSLELIHMASLIHDDVIDNADLRRGRPTIKAKWGNRIAMYTGDFILARSMELITEIEDAEFHRILADTLVDLSIGEIEQIRDKYNFDQNLRTYLRRIKRKTALLIAVSCLLGAKVARADEYCQRKLYRYGYFSGMAFQITDDILDFTSTKEKLGKPAGEDLIQGNITLPVLFALRDQSLNREIRKVNGKADPEAFQEIVERIKAAGAVEEAQKVAELYVRKALQALDDLPDNETKPLLREMVLFIGNRKF
jgi:heptaprenyl diphosphate synthase